MNHDTPHYTKVASHEATNGEFDTCLLLYSGGLDTSVMLTWLQEKYNCNVITLTVNIGQTVDDLDAIAEKAKMLGAIETITVDARDRFADELLSLAIKANADYQGGYALCTPLGRIIISQLAVEYAEKYNCTALLKGHQTIVIGRDGRRYVNETGNPGMATPGSGDVLTGIITALAGQGLTCFDAACAGAYIHGSAGDLAAEQRGEYGMTAADIIDKLPEAFLSCKGF